MTERTEKIEITNPTGLHARPAVKLTKLAKTFPAATVQVALAAGGPWIDAKSVVKVMALKAARGTALYVRAGGEQGEAALAALAALVRRDFDEGPGLDEGPGFDKGPGLDEGPGHAGPADATG